MPTQTCEKLGYSKTSVLQFLLLAICFTFSGNAYAQTSYCGAAAGNSNYEWIKSVTVGDMQNSSAGARYQDFTSKIAELEPGQSVAYSLEPGFSGGTFVEQWAIFIDFNQDGDFLDAGELVASQSSRSTIKGIFTVPTNAASGSTRMRIVMRWGGAPTSCGTGFYGEVEDYTITISGQKNEGQTLLEWNSAPNSWVGRGETATFSPDDGDFTLRPIFARDGVTIEGASLNFTRFSDGMFFRLEFDSAGEVALAEESYSDAYRYPFNDSQSPAVPGLSASSTGRGCNRVLGSFEILTLELNAAGDEIERFAASFTHYCEQQTEDRKLEGTILFNVLEPEEVQYCDASAVSQTYEWIDGVRIGDFESIENEFIGYEDKTEKMTGKTIQLTPGETIDIALIPGYRSSAYPERWAIWLDLNADGDFYDEGEEIYRTPSSIANEIATEYVVPADLPEETRLRVRMWYQANAAANPCGVTQYGQVEDYTVVKKNSAETVIMDFEDLAHTGEKVRVNSYTKDGFKIAADLNRVDQFSVWGPQAGIRYAGSATLDNSWVPATIYLEHVTNAPFNLISMDLTKFWDGVQVTSVLITGIKSDGSQVSRRISLEEFGLETYEFPEFTDVVRVEWHDAANGSNGHQVDNIVLQLN